MSIQPMLPYLTLSEIHTVMTSGFATVAGGVLAAYISLGVSMLQPLLLSCRLADMLRIAYSLAVLL